MHLQRLYSDETGVIISAELTLLSTIVLIGLITGITASRDALLSELSDIGGAVQDFNQCYQFYGIVGHSASSHGSNFKDALDFCDDADDVSGAIDNCIVFGAPADEGSGPTSTVTTYTNSDATTDISGSQNLANMKWEIERGSDPSADALTDAIVDCIAAGNVAEIVWTDSSGNVRTFTADTISGGPGSYLLGGTGDSSGAGKMYSATVTCVED